MVSDLKIDEDMRNDAGDITSGGEDGVGHNAHKSDLGAAVDEADAARGQSESEFVRYLAIDGLGAIGGGAEDGDIANGG